VSDYRGSKAADFDFEALSPEEAVEFFRAKGYAIGFDWRDVWQAEHQRAFTVAKAMTVDLLEDIRGVVDKAIAEGIDFKDFQEHLEPILRARGWWGRALMMDPLTGEKREVQLGSARRLGIIYDTNLRTSLAAGRWEQIERTKADLPYLRYVDPDPNPRPEHLEWSGTVLRQDDPWWDTHYTPNGWNCKCYVDALSADDLKRYGYEVDPAAPPSPTYTYTNERTGQTYDVPQGVDPEFAYNVGKTGIVVPAENALQAKLAAADRDIAAAVEKMASPKPTLDGAIESGKRMAGELGGLPEAAASKEEIVAWRRRLLDRLDAEVGRGKAAIVKSRGRGATLVRDASRLYPRLWAQASDTLDLPLVARLAGEPDPRGFYDPRSGLIEVRNLTNAVHEFGHRLQAAMPELNSYFQQLHERRTRNEPIRALSELRPGSGYGALEMGQEDKYADIYFGKVYGRPPAALEVMAMTYQGLLAGDQYYDGLDQKLIRSMLAKDPELLHLGIGLLFNYAP
jgi:hypothetical protein